MKERSDFIGANKWLVRDGSKWQIDSAEGTKIGWKDGMKAIYCNLRYNLFC